VRHSATNSYGTRWKNVSAYIKVNNVVAPVADFTGTPLSGTAPMNVQFTDASTRSPTSWSWNFGDSGTATTQNPSHTYTSAGTYDVSLTAANMGGSNATVKAGYVSVTAAQVSNQATNIEGMTAKSTIIIGDAANKQTLINYDPATLFQPSQSTVKTRLPNDQIFFFDGHGNPGAIQINEVNGEEFLAQNDDNGYDFNSTSATYGNLKLAVFSGCHTGETDSIAGNLVDVVSSKGAGCAIGYIGYILPDATYNWSSPFWDSIQQGKSIIQSQTDGLNSVIEDPLCQSMTPYNTWKYCGYDHTYIQGSGCQHPLPEVMPSLLTQNIKSSASDIQSKEKAAIIQIKPYQAQEQQVIRQFSNEEITPKYEKSTKYSYGTLDIYTAENVTYKVNRNTGRIQSRFVNDIDSTSGSAIIDLNQGYSVAEAYAKEKSPEFWDDEKGKVIKTINQVAKDHELVYSWRQYFCLPNSSSNDSHEIAGYNIIDITLDARDSQVKFYHEWFIPKDTNLDLDPNISEEQSWELVKKHFENTGINITDKMQTHKFGLFIVIDDNNTQHLAWQFEIKQSTENPEYYGGQIIVDAHNGQIVQDIRYG